MSRFGRFGGAVGLGLIGLVGSTRPGWSQTRMSIAEAGARIGSAALRAAAEGLAAVGPALAAVGVRLRSLGPELAIGLDGDWDVDRLEVSIPPESWNQQDPGDSVYRAARAALNRGHYTEASYLFGQIRERFARSTYAPDSYYWEAFARYRQGSNDGLRTALRLIERQEDEYPDAATHDDAAALAQRIRGQLAQAGDQQAAREVRVAAERAATDRDESRSERDRARADRDRQRRGSRCDDEDDERMAALNALLQMDEDRAMPILRKVMARRDPESVCLRRKAVFLISQHSDGDAETMLLQAIRSDPDPEVREQGVFWLSQVGGEHAAIALDSILRSSTDAAVQEKAIFALSQHDSERAMRSLRDFAQRAEVPANLRENAIFWLGQSDRADNGAFLKSLFKSVKEESLKEKIIFSISQHAGRDDQRWLIDLAADPNEDVEIRKKAIFWAGQSGVALPELFGLYDRTTNQEIREGLIFAYSQRSERAAVDKLIQIAKTDKDRELRKKALFWLSQSNDPRVAALLDEILNKP